MYFLPFTHNSQADAPLLRERLTFRKVAIRVGRNLSPVLEFSIYMTGYNTNLEPRVLVTGRSMKDWVLL